MNEDILKNAEYVYSGRIKWGLKRFTCRVSYYTEEALPDLDYVICSIVASSNEGVYEKRSLGIMLGFSMVDNQPEAYYDKAEVKLFEDILTLVEKNRLILIHEDYVEITELGKISIANKTLYRFFRGRQDIYEHLTFSYPFPEALLMFPFQNDMGIHTSLQKGPQYWPDDEEIPSIIGRKPSQLIKRINLQSVENNFIFEAESEQYFDVEVRKVPVKLYIKDDDYFPVAYNGDVIAPMATQLFEYEENAIQKENAILECLFSKLWDDKTAVLDYESLEPYFELVDYEELTKDSRTKWSDLRLFGKIVEMANSTCWLNISNNCDLDVLYQHLGNFIEYLDWEVITGRVDDEFLQENFNNYPWDLEVLSEDTTRDVSLIQSLILKAGVYSPEWDWEALSPRLEKDFVLSNLSLVNVDLSDYTENSELVRSCLLGHIDRRWDWGKVESDFDLSFILDNILVLQGHLGFKQLFDRVFVDDSWSKAFINDKSFIAAVQKNVKEGGNLSSLLFNEKDYAWSDELIHSFVSLGLIDWNSTRYTTGFECNPYIIWDKSFFSNYYTFVQTQIGRDHVSSNILDETSVIEFQDFEWNWTNLSGNQNISTDFVKANYTLPWDWKVLTERMFEGLRYNNIGHPAFIDKWDWVYLSDHLPFDFILENLIKFANYWDWSSVLDRIVTEENKLDISWLSKVAVSINAITDTTSREAAWAYLSEGYSYEEFKDILRKTFRDSRFSWDLSMLYEKSEFDIFTDLSECEDFIDWESLSFSKAFDQHLTYDPQSGIRKESWYKDVKELIIGLESKWDFTGLSTFMSLIDKDWFLSKYASKLDWEYISLHSPIFATEDKQQLNNVITAYKKYISFAVLSERQDINLVQIVKAFPKETYDYNALIANGIWRVSLSDIENHPRYQWDWKLLSSYESFKPTDEFLIRYADKDWDWNSISKRDSAKLWSSISLLLMMASNEKIRSQADWKTLTGRSYFPANPSLISMLPEEEVNWDKLSGSDMVLSLLPDLADSLNWQEVSKNSRFPVTDISMLEEYADDLNWSIVCKRSDFVFSNEILEKFTDRIDWTIASSSETIDFTVSLIDKYVDYWDWPSLVRNKAFFNKVEIRDRGYDKQEKIISFVNAFPYTPRAYHFTHMSNAVKIIKSHKLQSRNKADGVFENSAGTNVSITSKAHGFARFYFTTGSPTQFYNECLGKDRSDGNYYSRALNLGLPKCPMPVFFVIDVEELLAKVPDKCFYSSGNMQKSSTRAYKVVDDPSHINAREIFNKYNKEARQQEFLVQDEVDLLSLSSLKICCYDRYQCEMLKHLVDKSPLRDRIIAKEELFERINRELHFKDTAETLEITTDYINQFEFRITYTDGLAPEILNTDTILREKGNSIFMGRYIQIKKDKPFSIYFEVSEPRKESWLIYTNN
jgi:hypothetical protein